MFCRDPPKSLTPPSPLFSQRKAKSLLFHLPQSQVFLCRCCLEFPGHYVVELFASQWPHCPCLNLTDCRGCWRGLTGRFREAQGTLGGLLLLDDEIDQFAEQLLDGVPCAGGLLFFGLIFPRGCFLGMAPAATHWAGGAQVIKRCVCLIRVSVGGARARWAHGVGVGRWGGGGVGRAGRWRPPTSGTRDRRFH